MALPAHLLQRLPPALLPAITAEIGGAGMGGERVLPLGLPELDEALPGGGLLRGGVVELAVSGGAALGTRFALAAIRAAQEEGRARGGEAPWCAFVDPSATLYAPGVAEAGVALDRLLVVRPLLDRGQSRSQPDRSDVLSRVALRLVEAQAFAVVVIDLVGVPGAAVEVNLGAWQRVVRRLSQAVSGGLSGNSEACVLLLTDAAAPRPLPLPVAQRIELQRPAPDQLRLRIAKDRRGRVGSFRSVSFGSGERGATKLGATKPVAREAHLRMVGG